MTTVIGKPLKIDEATINFTRPSVARVCIEVDLLNTLPHHIWIGTSLSSGFWQAVASEGLPSYCTLCSKLGHTSE